MGIDKEHSAWRAGTRELQGTSPCAQAGTARIEERAGKECVACRYGIAVGLLTVRPCRYGKETRAGRQKGCREGRYGGDSCIMHIHHNQLIT